MNDHSPRPDLRRVATPLLRALEAPAVPWVAIGLALLLSLPAVFTGVHGEAHLQRLVASDSAALGDARAAWDLHRWLDTGTAARTAFADHSGLWSWPQATGWGAFRPLASLTQALELRFWPEQTWLRHLHDVLWRGLLVLCAALVLQRFLGSGWIGSLAILLFASDDLGAAATGSITERGTLMAGCFVLLALLAHDLWQRDGRRAGRWGAPLALLLALASAEASYAGLALLVAHSLCFGQGPKRWTALALPLLVAAAWSALYLSVAGGDLLDAPLAWATGLGGRLPIEALAQLGLPAIEGIDLVGWSGVALAVAGTLSFVGVAVLLLPLFQSNVTAGFWSLALGLMLLPASASSVAGGARVVAGVASAAIVAQLTAAILHTARDGRLNTLRPAIVGVFGLLFTLHGIVALVAAPVRAAAGWFAERRLTEADAGVPADALLPEQQLVIVHAPDLERGPFLLLRRAATGGVVPASARVLTWGAKPLAVERSADDAIRIILPAPLTQPSGNGLTGLASAAHPNLRSGEEIEIEGFAAKVLAPTADGATRLEFTFDVPCDNPSLRWVTWNGTTYEPFVVPIVE